MGISSVWESFLNPSLGFMSSQTGTAIQRAWPVQLPSALAQMFAMSRTLVATVPAPLCSHVGTALRQGWVDLLYGDSPKRLLQEKLIQFLFCSAIQEAVPSQEHWAVQQFNWVFICLKGFGLAAQEVGKEGERTNRKWEIRVRAVKFSVDCRATQNRKQRSKAYLRTLFPTVQIPLLYLIKQ